MGATERRILVAVALLASAAAASPAVAADDLPPALSTVGGTPRPGRDAWQVAGGVRLGLVRDPAFDPFADTDVLPQVSLAASRAFAPASGLGLYPAVGIQWDAGGSHDAARGARADLSMQRVSLALEARYAPLRWVHVGLRLAPGLEWGSATVTDPSTPVAPLKDDWRVLSVDASASAAVRITQEQLAVGFWLVAEGGYGWSQGHDIVLRPDLAKGDLHEAGATAFGRLNTQGAFMRLAVAISY
jgi:hypothetical protein